MADNNLKISVIIPAYNEESCIADCVRGVLSQDYENKEIIVVNDNSEDRTSEIAKSLGVKVIDFDVNHGASFARNTGVRESSGDAIYFLDADVVVKDKSLLSKLAEDFEKADAVIIRNVQEKPKTFIQACLNIPLLQLSYGDEIKIISNAPENDPLRGYQAIRRDVFLKLGGFNENIPFYFEDREIHTKFYSLGYKALYDPRLVMHSITPQTWSEFLRQCKSMGRGIYYYYKQTGILHYKAILFWGVYVLSGLFSPFHILPLALFAVMNSLLVFWILKTIYESRDVVHSIGFVFLHPVRTVIASIQLFKLLLSAGGGE